MSKSWVSKRIFGLVMLLAVGMTGWSYVATAQDEEALPEAASPEAVASDQGEEEAAQAAQEVPQASKGVAIEEVVVTARKREESLQETPVSVTAFSADDIEQRGYTGLDDIAAATPGFTFEPYITGGAHANAVIRGQAQQFTTARIQNVSFFLDGVYLQRQSMLDLGMVDMERIEVVKGPQNALYGRNAFAGAVNYVTQRPGNELGGYFSMGLGDNEREELRFSVSSALNGAGTLLGKFTAGLREYEGHTKNDHPVADANPAGPNLRGNLGGWDDETYTLSLLYEPTDRLLVRGGYYRTEMLRETAAGYSISGVNAARFGLRFDNQNDLNCNVATVPDIQPQPPRTHTGFSAWCGELPRYASDVAQRTKEGIIIDPRAIGTIADTDVITLTGDYEIRDNLSVHYLFGYADHNSFTDGGASDEDPLAGRGIVTNAIITQIDNQDPAGYTFANTASSRPNSVLESFSHELRFDWEFSERMRTSMGLYYSEVEDQEWTELFINDLCNADTPQNIQNCNTPLSAPNSLASQTVLTAGVAYDQYTRQHGGEARGEWSEFNDSITALFGSISYDFTERLEGSFEARLSVEDKAITRFTDSFAVPAGETITYNPPQDPVLPFGNSLPSQIVVPEDDESYEDFTPRGILNWKYADDRMVYFSAAKGVKAGGFNNADSPSDLTYDPEENWTYEIGSKNVFPERGLVLNAALFFIDWTGLQGGVPPTVAGLSTSDIITNIGGASSVGLELESSLNLSRAFSVDLGLNYTDASYDDDVKYAAGRFDTGSFHCDGVTCPMDGDVSGNQLARTSKEQVSLGLNYVTDIAGWLLSGRLDTNYQSRQYVTPLNLAWVPSRQLTNASIRLTSLDERFDLSFWSKNITDEDYAANSFYIGVFNQYMVGKGPGRTFGANLKYNF